MRVDLDYLRKMLDVFLNADTAHITFYDFPKSDVCYIDTNTSELDECFLFHFQLLVDNRLIGNRNVTYVELRDLGLSFGMNGECTLNIVPLRLTQSGHDFANILNEPDIFSTLKEQFSRSPFETIYSTGQELIKHYAKKKLDLIMGE